MPSGFHARLNVASTLNFAYTAQAKEEVPWPNSLQKDEEFLLMADNRLDRRLIEGILTDRDATIQEIREKYDVSEAGVLRRASELGLMRQCCVTRKALQRTSQETPRQRNSVAIKWPRAAVYRAIGSFSQPAQATGSAVVAEG